jgi:hypothetical protein
VGNVEPSKAAAETTTQIVLDDTAPHIVPVIIGTLGNAGWYVSGVRLTWDVTDPESGITSTSGCDPVAFTSDTAGVTTTCTATNGAGLPATMSVTVKIDKTAPTIMGMRSGCTLWPPNAALVQVGIVTAEDVLSGLALDSFTVDGVSNEPGAETDVVIGRVQSGGFVVRLRAERLGGGHGRIYSLRASAKDRAGNATVVTGTCTVPHDQRR